MQWSSVVRAHAWWQNREEQRSYAAAAKHRNGPCIQGAEGSHQRSSQCCQVAGQPEHECLICQRPECLQGKLLAQHHIGTDKLYGLVSVYCKLVPA